MVNCLIRCAVIFFSCAEKNRFLRRKDLLVAQQILFPAQKMNTE
jgi:hypothetical protein